MLFGMMGVVQKRIMSVKMEHRDVIVVEYVMAMYFMIHVEYVEVQVLLRIMIVQVSVRLI
jgi:hypothetical protein